MNSHRPLAAFIGGLLIAGLSSSASAQQAATSNPRGSRFVATDDWMMDAIVRLRQRGFFPALDPLSQPWDRNEVAGGLAAIPLAAIDTMPRQTRYWLRLLHTEFANELARLDGHDTPQVGFLGWAGGVTATSPRVDPLFPLREGVAPPNGATRNPATAWPQFGAGVWAERGPFTTELRLGVDLTLRRADPDGHYPGRIFDVLPDNQIAYVSAQVKDAAMVVGRLRRNWAPVGSKGLMLSDDAIGIPQIGYVIGGRNLVLRGMVGELDTLQGLDRFIAAHRVEYLRDNFAISVGEAKVYGSRTGPLITNLSPVEFFFLTGDKAPGEDPTNTTIDGQLWLRNGKLTAGGELLVDDFALFHDAPARGAISGSLDYLGPTKWMELGIDYRAVLSFAYWTATEERNNGDQWTYFGRGIGDNQSDYDRLTLHASMYPGIDGLRLTPTLAVQRKGEWDMRHAGIPIVDFAVKPTFLQGVAEKTVRLALAGRYQPMRHAFAEWDSGVNFVANANHVAGNSLTEFSSMLRIGLTWTYEISREH